MKLSADEALLFFKLMLPLQFFVNGRLGILKAVENFEDYKKASFEDKFKVRNALFDNVYLIDDFIDENPQDIPMKDLAIAAGWKRFVKQEFCVARYTKTHAVFIGEADEVYEVVGLTSSLNEFLPAFLLPQIVEAVLLPFQHKIVNDGLIVSKQIYLGGNIKRELRDVYTKAKKDNRIIKTL